MSQTQDMPQDLRRHPRLKLPAMYTLVRVRPEGKKRFCWSGHVYDISATGMRFELDQAVADGTRLELRMTLPGRRYTSLSATGTVVRRHDDMDEPGPVRMGVNFDAFSDDRDRQELEQYIATSRLAA